MNPKLVGRAPLPDPLPIGSADSADAEREKRSLRSSKSRHRPFVAMGKDSDELHPDSLSG
jgi:hypothetical protein